MQKKGRDFISRTRTPSCMHAWAMQRDAMAGLGNTSTRQTVAASALPYVHHGLKSPWINRAKRAPHGPMLPPYGPHVHVPRAQSMRRAPRDMSRHVRVRTAAPPTAGERKKGRTILCTPAYVHGTRPCSPYVHMHVDMSSYEIACSSILNYRLF
jgi:hypothetical protein